jgi:hypothetical protein
MSKKRTNSSCSLKDKLELLKRIGKGESATELASEIFFYILFGLTEISEKKGSD